MKPVTRLHLCTDCELEALNGHGNTTADSTLDLSTFPEIQPYFVALAVGCVDKSVPLQLAMYESANETFLVLNLINSTISIQVTLPSDDARLVEDGQVTEIGSWHDNLNMTFLLS